MLPSTSRTAMPLATRPANDTGLRATPTAVTLRLLPGAPAGPRRCKAREAYRSRLAPWQPAAALSPAVTARCRPH